MRIVDEQGRDVAPGEVGEIYLRGPHLSEFTYNNDDAKRREIALGDLMTVGDVGYRDAEGYVFLCDRKRDMIISGGVNIYPQQTEDRLLHQELSNSPRHQILGNLTFPLYRDRVFAGLEARYISGRINVDGPEVPAYWVANATLFSQHWANGLELSASIYNLLARRFYDPGSGNVAQKVIAQDGRSLRVKLTYHF